jgi:hypothetical protein
MKIEVLDRATDDLIEGFHSSLKKVAKDLHLEREARR